MKERRRKFNKRRFIRFVVLACAIYGLILIVDQEFTMKRLAREQTKIESQIADAELEQEELRRTIDYVDSDEYTEREARDKMGMVKDDEIKFIINSPSPTPGN